jgi:hypothetical protein
LSHAWISIGLWVGKQQVVNFSEDDILKKLDFLKIKNQSQSQDGSEEIAANHTDLKDSVGLRNQVNI